MNIESVLVQSQGFTVSKNKKNLGYLMVKRVIDIVISFIGILFLIPLAFIIKAVFIVNKDYDSIFFKQKRIGKDGKLFVMYKFRTMVPDADAILFKLIQTDKNIREEYKINKKLKNDPRITKIGKFLRKMSLDEFPQFINVFLGDMSIVGNRPYLPREKVDMDFYSYKSIITTKPGITGLWQTNGRSNVTFQERLKIEKKYSNVYSFKLDMKIFFNTIIKVIKKDGAK